MPNGDVLKTEDWYLHHAHHLKAFADDIRRLRVRFNAAEATELDLMRARMLREFGEALKRTVDAPGPAPVLLKTPSVENIESFFEFFGCENMLIVVRDGRDTCESFIRSKFADSYEETFRNWACHAEQLLKFLDSDVCRINGKRIKMVRYEDVLSDPEMFLRDTADWLGQVFYPEANSDYKKIAVIGSSELGRQADGSFKFEWIPPPPGFNPVGRWKKWPKELCDEFKAIANKQLVAFGYEQDADWMA